MGATRLQVQLLTFLGRVRLRRIVRNPITETAKAVNLALLSDVDHRRQGAGVLGTASDSTRHLASLIIVALGNDE